ncbi:MAG: hypothetical protein Q8936_01350 [Bacillota bacterium]|nr:hypothetical protein [Bacillota bacterium]
MKEQKVFKKQIALELMGMGYRCLYTEPNKNNSKLNVFVFEQTDELLSRLQELIIKH